MISLRHVKIAPWFLLVFAFVSCQPVKKESVSIAFSSPSVALPFLVLTPEEARLNWDIKIVSPGERLSLMQQRLVDLAESDFFELYSLTLQQRSYENPIKGLAVLKSDLSLLLNATSVNTVTAKQVLGMANFSVGDYLLEYWYGTELIERRHVGSESVSRQLLREGVIDGAVLGVHERYELLHAGFVKQKSLLNEDTLLGVLVLVNRDMSAKVIDDVLHDYRLGVQKLRSGQDLSYALDPYRMIYDVEYGTNYSDELFFPPALYEELSAWIILRFPFTEKLSYDEMFWIGSTP